jgi:ABC-2 type transport system ATP-binding protein
MRRYGVLAGIDNNALSKRVDTLLALLGLDEHRLKPVRALSKGNLQRLGLARALLADPDLLILDEPTHGFDPMWTARFRDLIANARRPNRTVLIASHDLAELSALADRVYILDHGKVARVVDTRSAAAVTTEYRLTVITGADQVPAVFPDARAVSDGIYVLPAVDTETLNVGLAELVRRGARLTSVAPTESALEYHFREVVEESKT